MRELGRRRRLAGALQSHHQDGRRRAAQFEAGAFRAERFHQHVMDDLDDLLAGRDGADDVFADRAGANLVDELLDDRQRHIGVDQAVSHFAQRLVDIGFGERTAPPEPVEHAAKAGL